MQTGISTLLAVGTFLFGLLHLFVSFLRRPRTVLPLPPGPKGFPIIGNLFNEISGYRGVPGSSSHHLWAKYLEMGKKYNSDIVHINVLGDHTIVLNSSKATNDLLEKRSGIYSDRPPMHMMMGLVGVHRRTFHQDFQPPALATYRPFIRQSTSDFLKKIAPTEYDPLRTPDIKHADLESYVRNHAGSIILRIVYGMTTQEEMNDYVQIAYLAAESLIATMNHGSFFVDYLPWLKYVPAWFPGASFKRKANAWAPAVSDLLNKPWERLKPLIKSGTAIPCFVTRNLERFDLVSSLDVDSDKTRTNTDPNMEEVVKNCAAVAYFGGSDTTVSMLMSSILALSHHPEVLTKAHEEIDRVVGSSRLPDLTDRKDLPYVEAFIKEVERMYPVTPLAIAHRVTISDVYDGYFIPKGTAIVANVWFVCFYHRAILHSEELYQDPLKFDPDRFLEDGKESERSPNPELYVFGFGRRICPGRYLALESAWNLIACLLATCDVIQPLKEDPKAMIDPVLDFAEGIIVHPKPYNCRIVPRSATALNLMKTGYPSEN
ncbi:cytochrome P450 [Dendrothele bispora CBS 962.96]|uniref:Cytochrome P450 n=1 Tax=Dendrothele bispora (strain CBS 962.96) TaxID=1314807 RepID=A0A4S8KQR9_DENBC|nr:cytochrome P450 [Dendrothele bispora CBS 962.96]